LPVKTQDDEEARELEQQAFLPKSLRAQIAQQDTDEDDHEEIELESGNTVGSRGQRFKSKLQSGFKRWWRLVLEILMVVTIVVLYVGPWVDIGIVRKDGWSPVPDFPKKSYAFAPDDKYLNDNMFESEHATLTTLHSWLELSADGRGYVHVDNPDMYGLGEPYYLKMNETDYQPVYMISGFHQLHCLSYLAQHYRTSLDDIDVSKHSVHCFDYLRQSIMCSADPNIEGKTNHVHDGEVEERDETAPEGGHKHFGASVGWGEKHTCRDWEALKGWANEHTMFHFRSRLMPDEAVL